MKKKILLLICAVFVLVLIGASALYSTLSDRVGTVGLATQPPTETQNTQPQGTEPQSTELSQTASETTEAPDYSAPDFTVLDVDGNERKLSEFEGKPVVLNFWASWCGPCKNEMPDFEEAYKKYGEEIHFVMVNCTGGQETVESAKEFIAGEGYTFPIYFDTTYEAASTYGASSIPLTYFIDAEGNMVTYGRGTLSAELLQKGIDMIYTEK